jgi:hypothetical protein
MRYRQTLETSRTTDEVFTYLADFARAVEWDPGIVEGRRLTPPPTGVGTRFELIALFRGRRQRFVYEVTEYDEGRRIVLHGDGEKAFTDDFITVEAGDAATRVGYEAEFGLKGVYRLAQPFMGSSFTKVGDDAMAGLQEQLDRDGPLLTPP